MDSNRPHRPRVSRETRLLLTTALVAVAALWVLARIRFPDLPATPNSVSPLLSQLATTPTFDGLAAEVAQLQTRLEPSLVALDASARVAPAGASPIASRLTALRVRDDLAITLIPAADAAELTRTKRVVASDTASGFGVVRVPSEAAVSFPTAWVARRPERPRYLMVTDTSIERIALRPVFVAFFEPIESVAWSDVIWMFPQASDVTPGSFVFTTAGEFAGMVIEHAGGRAMVPSPIVLAELERLVRKPVAPAGDVGVRVQALTADVATATGASVGVVVTWVDSAGAAAGAVAGGDVIEAADGRTLPTPDHWRVHLARLEAGATLTLRVRRRGELRDVQLIAPAPERPAVRSTSLGLRMRQASGSGAEIVGVEPESAATQAGLAAGDVITSIGDLPSPTPAQVRAAFTTAPEGKPVLLGVMRGATRFVTTLRR